MQQLFLFVGKCFFGKPACALFFFSIPSFAPLATEGCCWMRHPAPFQPPGTLFRVFGGANDISSLECDNDSTSNLCFPLQFSTFLAEFLKNLTEKRIFIESAHIYSLKNLCKIFWTEKTNNNKNEEKVLIKCPASEESATRGVLSIVRTVLMFKFGQKI